MIDPQTKTMRYLTIAAAPTFFWLSLIFLICQAVLVVMWVDVPNLRETISGRLALSARPPMTRIEFFAIFVMLLIWPIIALESAWHWMTRPWIKQNRWFHFYSLLFCICPSLRMCARSVEMDRRIWLPGFGWRHADARLRRRLEHRLGMPMIWIALLIMPVLIIEFFMKTQVAHYRWLRIALHTGTGIIWFCFAAEFILMVSVAEKKIAYCKKHWIDLAIIILPLFSFLRSLQLLRATLLTKLVGLSQLNQLARMYRLRGTAMKALRALILFDLIERYLISRDPEKAIARLKVQLSDSEKEVRILRRKIARLERSRREQQ